MRLANIYPVANQELYREESVVMILAHLAKKGLYRSESFNPHAYTIMDNGLFEGEQVSTSLQACVDIAENSGVLVDEIIIPDTVNSLKETQELFIKNLPTIHKYNKKYVFMAVAQANNYAELRSMIHFYNAWAAHFRLTIGISKLAPFDRSSEEAIDIYRECMFPIHLLGLKDTFEELDPVRKIVRSCDTSQLAYIAKHENVSALTAQDIWKYTRDEKAKAPIDLEHDKLNSEDLYELRNKLCGV